MKLKLNEKWMISFLKYIGNKTYQKDEVIQGNKIIENINYAFDHNERHLLDIIYPKQKKSTYPVIVSIHGGGGGMNSKDKIYRNYGIRLAQNEFAVISMNYRLVQTDPFPAQIEDVFSVLKFINNNASKYHLDPNNVFLVGDSAGAYFAAYAVCVMNNDFLKNKLNLFDKFPINAIALNCGPYDFDHFLSKKIKFPMKKMIVSSLFGSREFQNLETYKHSSVIKYINKNFAPTYIMDAEKMSFVPQAQMLSQELLKHHIRHECRYFGKDTHLIHSFHIENKYKESQLVIDDTWKFFKEHLKI